MNVISKYLVSIIVPVYKVEKYIRRCIDSLINQTYKHIEIILVDDGSPDKCGEICDEYSIEDIRIKVIHKKNGGLSDARNHGIDLAVGEYILFVDSDDYIELDAIEKLVLYANDNKLDIVTGDVSRLTFSDANSLISSTELLGGTISGRITVGEDYLVDCINKRKYSVAVWTRMYRTSLIKENNLYFIKNLLHEDENWTPRILLVAKRVGYYNFSFYNYCIRNDSITQSKNKKKHILDIIKTCEELETEYDRLNITSSNKRVLKDYLARLYMNTCTLGDYDNKFYKGVISKITPFRNSYFFKTKLEMFIFIMNIKLYRFIKLNFN